MSRDKEIFQCCCCGKIHKVDEKYKPGDDDIYEILWCPKCKEHTKQLYCGDDESEIYELYNVNLDSRYY